MLTTTYQWCIKDYNDDTIRDEMFLKEITIIDFGEVQMENSCNGCESFKEYGMLACEGCAG